MPWAAQEIEELAISAFRNIHPAILVSGFTGLVLVFVGCFLVVRAKQLHPYWTLAGMLSFVGVVILATLPEGHHPRSLAEALNELRILLARFKRLFVAAFVVAALVTLAWALLFQPPV